MTFYKIKGIATRRKPPVTLDVTNVIWTFRQIYFSSPILSEIADIYQGQSINQLNSYQYIEHLSLKIILIGAFWSNCDLITSVNCIFLPVFQLYNFKNFQSMVCLNILLILLETAPLQIKILYLYIDILVSHIKFKYFSAFIEFHAK